MGKCYEPGMQGATEGAINGDFTASLALDDRAMETTQSKYRRKNEMSPRFKDSVKEHNLCDALTASPGTSADAVAPRGTKRRLKGDYAAYRKVEIL